jgi:hypothetical protein
VPKGKTFVSLLHFRPCHGSKFNCRPITAEVQFGPKPFRVGVMVDQVPQKQEFLRVLRFSRQLSFHQFSKLDYSFPQIKQTALKLRSEILQTTKYLCNNPQK